MSAEADIATAVVLYALADAVRATPGPWISADEGPGDWPVYAGGVPLCVSPDDGVRLARHLGVGAVSRLDEIKARADAATPGPWISADEGPGDWPVYAGGVPLCVSPDDGVRGGHGPADAEFIAAAREDVPWLVSEVERLTAERDALAAQVERVEALAEEWRYKGQFGWGAWQLGEGPDPEGYVMDHCAFALRAVLAGSEADTSDTQPTDQEDHE